MKYFPAFNEHRSQTKRPGRRRISHALVLHGLEYISIVLPETSVGYEMKNRDVS